MLYNDICSSLFLSRGLSPRCPIKRGIRQGCPISPLLFILAIELMSIFIKNCQDVDGMTLLGRRYIISQFADDKALIFKK